MLPLRSSDFLINKPERAARVHPLLIGWLESNHEFESVFCFVFASSPI